MIFYQNNSVPLQLLRLSGGFRGQRSSVPTWGRAAALADLRVRYDIL